MERIMTTPERMLVEVREVSKAFGGVQALNDVTLDIAAGEVHALVGENGAGKSTLIKVLSGSCRPDSGEVVVDGTSLSLDDVAASEAAGIAVIHQESTAFPHLNAEDNIFVGAEPRRFMGLLLDRAVMERRTEGLLDRLGEKIDPKRPVGELPVAQRQMVGMARALSRDSRLLVMDEPTASLSDRETETLFRIIRQLQDQGVSILYVSHRLEEVFELADRVTVLRDGRWVDTRPIGEVTRDSLIRMMVGRDVGQPGVQKRMPTESGRVLLDVRNLTRESVFSNVTFSVRAGEIVGLAGLVGAGRSEVARTIFGVDRPTSGSVTVAGSPLRPGSVQAAMELGVGLVPEDRQHQGLVLPMSINDNLALAVQRTLTRWGFRSGKRETALAERMTRELDLRTPSVLAPAETLSGGNQQKLVLGKWLAASPRVLLLDEPTRGIDVGAKAEVHRMIRQLAGNGLAVLFISSELPEILLMSDRIIVMRSGAVAGQFSRDEATQERILELALTPGGATDYSASTTLTEGA